MAALCDPFVTVIQKTECIGNSLTTINSNFLSLDTGLCEAKSVTDALKAVQGILKGTSNGITAATQGIDYYKPGDVLLKPLQVVGGISTDLNITSTNGNINCSNGKISALLGDITKEMTIRGTLGVTGTTTCNGLIANGARAITTNGLVILQKNPAAVPDNYLLVTDGNIRVGSNYLKPNGFETNKDIVTTGGNISAVSPAPTGVVYAREIVANEKVQAGFVNVNGRVDAGGGFATIDGIFETTTGHIKSASGNIHTTTGQIFSDSGTITGGTLVSKGEIRANGDVIAYYSSDKRLKNNITNITNALDKIDVINGVEFEWNEELQDTHKGADVGVIAQEIETVLPSCVVDRNNGYKAVRYEKIIPLLIEAIKELKNEVQLLKNTSA